MAPPLAAITIGVLRPTSITHGPRRYRRGGLEVTLLVLTLKGATLPSFVKAINVFYSNVGGFYVTGTISFEIGVVAGYDEPICLKGRCSTTDRIFVAAEQTTGDDSLHVLDGDDLVYGGIGANHGSWSEKSAIEDSEFPTPQHDCGRGILQKHCLDNTHITEPPQITVRTTDLCE